MKDSMRVFPGRVRLALIQLTSAKKEPFVCRAKKRA
jgi:hypothetical protein